MAAVVNILTFRDPVDPSVFDGVVPVIARMREIEGFEDLHIVHTGEREVVLIIFADTTETLDRLATEVGSPWMMEHVVPLLAAPPHRRLGPVIQSSAGLDA